MTKKNYFLVVISFSFLIQTIYAKKPRLSPKERKPLDMEDALWCNACQAIVREVLMKVYYNNKESDVMYAMDNVCKGDLSYYEFPPMALKPACETFLSEFERLIEKEFIKKKSNIGFEKMLCTELTQACEGVKYPGNEGGPAHYNEKGSIKPDKIEL